MSIAILTHNLMHLITVLLGLGLFLLSILTYSRTKKRKFLMVGLAFFIYSIEEIFLFTIAIGIMGEPNSIYFHFLNLVVLSLFAMGLIK